MLFSLSQSFFGTPCIFMLLIGSHSQVDLYKRPKLPVVGVDFHYWYPILNLPHYLIQIPY